MAKTQFDKCVFGILGKLTVSQLTSLCNFVDSKITHLERELNKFFAYTNIMQDYFNVLEGKIRAGERLFDEITRSSPLLSVAKEIDNQCDVSTIFQGAFEAAETVKTTVRDAVYMSRQILTVNGLTQMAKNQLTEQISKLRDVCTLLQLIVLEKTKELSSYEKQNTNRT